MVKESRREIGKDFPIDEYVLDSGAMAACIEPAFYFQKWLAQSSNTNGVSLVNEKMIDRVLVDVGQTEPAQMQEELTRIGLPPEYYARWTKKKNGVEVSNPSLSLFSLPCITTRVDFYMTRVLFLNLFALVTYSDYS